MVQRYVDTIGTSKFREIVKSTMKAYDTEETILQTIETYEYSEIDSWLEGKKGVNLK